MWHQVKGKAWFFLLALLLVQSLSGCYDQPKRPEKRALQPVALQLQWLPQAQFAGYYVALEKGWYREEGLDLTIRPGGPDLCSTDLVASGVSDFGTALLADLSVAIDKGLPLISLAQIQQANGLLLISRRASGIKAPQDLVGKRVGIWFGIWETQFNALLAKTGISDQKIQVRSQGWSMDPFLKGELEVASAMIYNEYHTVLASGLRPEDLNIIDYRTYGLDFPGDTLFTSRQLIKTKPDIVLRMLRASLKGWRYAMEHPVEAVDMVLQADKSGVQKRTHQLVMMQEIIKLVQKPGQVLGQTDPQAMARMLSTLKQSGVITGTIQPEEIYTREFWEKAQ